MSSVHHSDRPARCLRHHVWMAACDDCRDAHTVVVRDRRAATSATR
ncbi:hypothetical protein [Geodermatophilus sp. DF01-2]|nr:hypothetical protein [Geodermatophilus sp. DF01_2]